MSPVEDLIDTGLFNRFRSLTSEAILPAGLADLRKSFQLLFRWCEFLAYQNGIYASAINRLVGYFVTKVELKHVSDEIRSKLEKILENDLEIYDKLREIGLNFMVYGNCFVSVLPPITRYVVCNLCNTQLKFSYIVDDPSCEFKWINYSPHFTCPACKRKCAGTFHDEIDTSDVGKIAIKIWNIHEISILWDPFLQNNEYIWRIPGYISSAVERGDPQILSKIPKQIIDCIKNKKFYKLGQDSILHLREANLAGIIDRGWGIPRMLSIFPHLYFVQLMHRYNEALAMDYVIPTRVISPAVQNAAGVGEGGEPLQLLSRNAFKRTMEQELAIQKRDPSRILISPIPIQYQLLGGEARSLAPVELLNFGVDVLLSSLGLPIEMYKGTMQVQAMPIALRIMENSMSFIPKVLNRALKFIVTKVCNIMKWPTPTVSLEKVTMADDLQRQVAKLQLMLQGIVSQTTGLRALGIDMKEEFLRMLEDEQFKTTISQKMQQKLQREGTLSQMIQGADSDVLNQALMGVQQAGMGMEAPAAGGGAGGVPAGAGGGGTAAGGGQAPVPPIGASPQQISLAALLSGQVPVAMLQSMSPTDLEQVAQQIAAELINKPESIRLSELRKLKQVHPLIHARVVAILEEIRSRMRLVGGELIRQLQGGGM